MPRGNFLLSSHKGKQKEPRGVPRDPRTGPAAAVSREPRPNPFGELPKLAVLVQQAHTHRRFKHMERLVFAATQQDSAGAALAFRQRSVAQKNAAYESALKPCFLFCVLFSNDRKWQAYSKPKKALKARKAI